MRRAVLLGGGRDAADSVRPKVDHDLAEPLATDAFLPGEGCGGRLRAGCSEWIAAEGNIDEDAPERLRDFLVSLNGRDIPIFFNSGGGYMGKARELGRILRERKISAGVGRTIPTGCRVADANDDPAAV